MYVCLSRSSCTTPDKQRNSKFYTWNTAEFRKTLTFGIPCGILQDTYNAISDKSKKFRWNTVLTKFRRHSSLLLNIVHWKLLFLRNSRLQVKERYRNSGLSIVHYQICQYSATAVAEEPPLNSGIALADYGKNSARPPLPIYRKNQ